ncbi:MAG: exodeoxyribonuclease V subunit gamma [Verrucomicrobia bacterium]|nr:exodeoxyribonuclease V subunit gamma [Verrucomicrobiota bacterium]
MALTLQPHLRFDDLFERLGNPTLNSVLARQPVIIPSLPFGAQLQRALSQKYGVCMGLSLQTARTFIHAAVGPGENSQWLKEQMQWLILPLVQKYQHHLGVNSPLAIRDRFALAGVLADKLNNYGHHRPEWVVEWYGAQAADAPSGWQVDLWQELRQAVGPDEPHPALQMHLNRSNAEFLHSLRNRFPRVIALATGSLDPLLVQVLRLLDSAGSDVQVHVLLPTLGYLGEIARDPLLLPAIDSEPEELEIAGGHPLLTSMGRNAIGTFALLEQLDPNYAHWPDPDEAQPTQRNPEPITLLKSLQQDIRIMRFEDKGQSKSADDSISVHSCFGPQRELEAIQDALFKAFADIPDLKPSDVHLVTPDLETYAPLARALFLSGSSPLPIQFTERPVLDELPLTQGLMTLLDCVITSRLQASDISFLLFNPAVLAHLETEDSELLRNWLEASGFTHGAGTSSPGRLGYARDRLISGYWLANDSDARYPDQTWVLPEADELGGNLPLLSDFCAWLSAIESTYLAWQTHCPATNWAQRIRTACLNFLPAMAINCWN